MICFVCATPYHIILSMLIKESAFPKQQADMVLYNHFDGSGLIADKLKSDRVFSHVVFLDEKSRTFKDRLGRALRSFWPGAQIRELAKNSRYSEIIFFTLDFLNISYVIREYERRRFDCRFSYGEDGIGTYIDPNTYVPSKTVNFLLRMSGRYRFLESIGGLYVLEPQLLQCPYRQRILRINSSSENRALLYCREKLWPQSLKPALKKVVYLQEPYGSSGGPIERDIIKLIKQIFSEEGFSLKLHPRTFDNQYEGDYVIRTNVPFECLAPESDMDHMILISILCTAAVTPGILYRKSPYIIYLYKLFPELQQSFDDTMPDFVECLSKSALYSERIFVPEDIAQLESILRFLNTRIDGEVF